MTSFTQVADLNRNSQDSTERHVYEELTFDEKGGALVKVDGNGTKDADCVVLAIGGTIMNLPKGTNAEVVMIGGGDDTNAKLAVILGPRDKQHKSKPGETWTQDPLDPSKRFGHTPNGVRIVGNNIALGDGAIQIIDGKIYLKGEVISEQDIVKGSAPAYKE